MNKRIIFDILLVTSFLFWPWYVTTGLVFVGIAIFQKFLEGIILVFFMDAIYSTSNYSGMFYGRFGIFILFFLVLFFAIEKFKTQLRF